MSRNKICVSPNPADYIVDPEVLRIRRINSVLKTGGGRRVACLGLGLVGLDRYGNVQRRELVEIELGPFTVGHQ